MKDINLCIMTPLYSPFVGGAEEQARQLAFQYNKLGINVYVVTDYQPGLARIEVVDGVEVYRILKYFQLPFKKFLKTILKINRYPANKKYDSPILYETDNKKNKGWTIKRHIRAANEFIKYSYMGFALSLFLIKKRISVVHCFLLNPRTIMVAAISKLLGKRVIIRQSGELETESLKTFFCYKLYKLILHRFVDRAVAISKDCENKLKSMGLNSQKIIVIPNGVDNKRFSPVNRMISNKLKIDLCLPRLRLIVFVGSIQFIKGVDVLVRSFSLLCKDYQDVGLMIVGRKTAYAEKFEELIKKYDLREKVFFIGESKRVYDYLRVSDVLVLPSRSEGLSNALIEAMSTGLPVIATKISGSIDVIENDKNGLLVPSEDSEALKDAIIRVLDDEVLAKRIAKNARKTIVDNYSLDKIVNRYIKMYDSMLNN